MPRTLLAAVLLCLAIFASAAHAQGFQVKVNYYCAENGRYWVSYGKAERHYCWDRKHYSTKTGVPAFILQYWEDKEREGEQLRQELEKKSVEMRRKVEEAQGAANVSRPQPGAMPARLSRGTPYRTVEASTKPVASPVPRTSFTGLETGAARTLVIGQLGEPHGAISNAGSDGDEEVLTYRLEGGGQASVRLKAGKLISFRLP